MRTEKIGLRDFLWKRRVPEVDRPGCDCGEGQRSRRDHLGLRSALRSCRNGYHRQRGSDPWNGSATTWCKWCRCWYKTRRHLSDWFFANRGCWMRVRCTETGRNRGSRRARHLVRVAQARRDRIIISNKCIY
ncbi:hypothetical protein BKA61DRAFT_184571 [Leptodontidium sp. MPI-SDFR-AT-0119]|nr:hypothetical protein BKA61DRAFT_184571 [Leptodontidium sp. MPI-SDFR-AT-0119]